MVACGKEKSLRLGDVETLLASKALIIDACRHVISGSGRLIPLVKRPVLFALARTLAEASRGGASRATLLSYAFGAKDVDESHRARLRVEIGRLRKLLSTIATIEATSDGFALRPRGARILWCWPRYRTKPTHMFSRFSAMAKAGRARRLRWRSGQASGPCSAPWTSFLQLARCRPSARHGRGVGWRRPCPDSRQACYSRPFCPAARL